MKYPYLVASLPVLDMDIVPPLPMERFLFEAKGVLSEADDQELHHLLANETEQCRSRFAAQWFEFDIDLRYRIAAVRAGRLGVDARTTIPYRSGGDAIVRRAVLDAFAKTNPLERELQIDQTRWRFLEELGKQEPFGLAAVLAFALQLRLTERWTGMSVGAGTTSLDKQLDILITKQNVEAA